LVEVAQREAVTAVAMVEGEMEAGKVGVMAAAAMEAALGGGMGEGAMAVVRVVGMVVVGEVEAKVVVKVAERVVEREVVAMVGVADMVVVCTGGGAAELVGVAVAEVVLGIQVAALGDRWVVAGKGEGVKVVAAWEAEAPAMVRVVVLVGAD
jgi:hypothetical protein